MIFCTHNVFWVYNYLFLKVWTCLLWLYVFAMLHTRITVNPRVLWPVWLNGWVFVYELSGCGFESSCSLLCLLWPWSTLIYRRSSFSIIFLLKCFKKGSPKQKFKIFENWKNWKTNFVIFSKLIWFALIWYSTLLEPITLWVIKKDLVGKV